MSIYSKEERDQIQKAYESMLADIRPHVHEPEQLAKIEQAYQYCLEQYDGKYLVSGKAYLFHLIEMARIAVLEVGRDADEGAEKIQASDCAGTVSLGMGGKPYAILFRAEVVDYQPLWFEATEEGTFTLEWETANATFHELTLVDNVTGTVTDMLARDSYSFEGSPDHYASRFKVVVGEWTQDDPDEPEPADEQAPFAFMMGDELVVNGEGTLQMFDVTGRMVLVAETTGTQSAIALPDVSAGVYVLRLGNQNGTRTQKIVLQ